jgi:hypothetical protein
MLISLVRDARPTAIWRGRRILARLLPQLLSEILVTDGEHAAVGVMDDDVLIGVEQVSEILLLLLCRTRVYGRAICGGGHEWW